MTKLPESFQHVRLELAREREHPDGNGAHGYDILLPLLADGQIDGELARVHKSKCRVRRFRQGDRDKIGLLHRGPGGRWTFDYDDKSPLDDEAGYRFGDERFILGEYVSIKEDDDDMHTFRVTRIEAL
jgi:hypothetical protein